MSEISLATSPALLGSDCSERKRFAIGYDLCDEAIEFMSRAEHTRLLERPAPHQGPVLNRRRVQQVLPCRDPYLFVDEVTRLDLKKGLIAIRYSLARAARLFVGHFPSYPVLPGGVQVEAIGQAGMLLYLLWQRQAGIVGASEVTLTHVLGARFIHPVTPSGELEVISRVIEGESLITIVGQCLHYGRICSVAAMKRIA